MSYLFTNWFVKKSCKKTFASIKNKAKETEVLDINEMFYEFYNGSKN